MKKRFAAGVCTVVLVLGALSVPGCALWREELPLQEATAEQLTTLLRERASAIQTMKGLFRAQIKSPGILLAQRVEGAMYYRRPGTLRLQGFNHVGGELFELALGSEFYRLRLPTLGRQFAGRVGELERMGQIGRPFQLSVWAVNGAIGVAAVSDGERAVLSGEGDRYRLDIVTSVSDGTGAGTTIPLRRIWFDRRTLQVVQEDRLTATGDVEATLEFDDFRPVTAPTAVTTEAMTGDASSPMLRPFKITTYDRQGQGTLMLTFHEIIPNPPLKPEELGLPDTQG